MKVFAQVPVEKLRESFTYDPASGILTKFGPTVTNPFGLLHANGYLRATLGERGFFVHRIAWALHYGEWPKGFLDHINGIPTDNRICNLRLATNVENCRNRRGLKRKGAAFKGVYQARNKTRFQARIKIGSSNHSLGTFGSREAAAMAYDRAALYFYGEFASTNWSLGLFNKESP